jgi:hypothetical protein
LDRFLLNSLISLPASAGKKQCALFFRNRKPCFSQQCQDCWITNRSEKWLNICATKPFNTYAARLCFLADFSVLLIWTKRPERVSQGDLIES